MGDKRPHFHGHRERLKQKFAERGAEALADYEILELYLFRSIPRRDTKPIAKALIDQFGNLASVLAASPARLTEISGVGEKVATDLKLIQNISLRMMQQELQQKPILSSWSQMIDYCMSAMAYKEVEEFRIIFLNHQNRILVDEVQQIGTIDHTPAYPREVVKRALELSASAIILVHNHPTGDPTPSHDDVEMTKNIIQAAGAIKIKVHDHVIIGKNGHLSFKALGLI